MKEILDRFRADYLALASRRMESAIELAHSHIEHNVRECVESQLLHASAANHYAAIASEVDALIRRLHGDLFTLKAKEDLT